MTKTLDKGSAILIQVEFQRKLPFGTIEYFDPVNPAITILAPDGTPQVQNAALLKNAIGKYYYICQTTLAWQTGLYKSVVTGADGAYSDVTKASAFQLL